jgi:hypothetical protein
MLPRLLILCLLLLTGAAPLRAQYVHTRGAKIVDGGGKPLMLHGISIGNWMVLEGYLFGIGPINTYQKEVEATFEDLLGPTRARQFLHQWRENFISQADIHRIRQDGFNTVRVPIHTKYFKTDDDEGFQLVDQLVKWCRAEHVYVILMMESGVGGIAGEASDDGPGYPWLLKDAGAQAQLDADWQRIARHYRNEPVILGYDLLNEPLLWPGFLNMDLERYIEPEYKRLTAAVRKVDPNHMLLLQPARGRFGEFGKPFDGNTTYSFHSYNATPDAAFLQQYLDFRSKYNVPILFSEVYAERSPQWLTAHIDHAEKNHIGWLIWPYKKMAVKSPGPYTFPAPANWDKVLAFAQQRRDDRSMQERNALRPPQDVTNAIFAEILENEKNAHVTVHPEYLQLPGITPH